MLFLSLLTKALTIGSPLLQSQVTDNGLRRRKSSNGRIIKPLTKARGFHSIPMVHTGWIVMIRLLRPYPTGNLVNQTQNGALLLEAKGGVSRLEKTVQVVRTLRLSRRIVHKVPDRVEVKVEAKAADKVLDRAVDREVDRVPDKAAGKDLDKDLPKEAAKGVDKVVGKALVRAVGRAAARVLARGPVKAADKEAANQAANLPPTPRPPTCQPALPPPTPHRLPLPWPKLLPPALRPCSLPTQRLRLEAALYLPVSLAQLERRIPVGQVAVLMESRKRMMNVMRGMRTMILVMVGKR